MQLSVLRSLVCSMRRGDSSCSGSAKALPASEVVTAVPEVQQQEQQQRLVAQMRGMTPALLHSWGLWAPHSLLLAGNGCGLRQASATEPGPPAAACLPQSRNGACRWPEHGLPLPRRGMAPALLLSWGLCGAPSLLVPASGQRLSLHIPPQQRPASFLTEAITQRGNA